MPTITTHTINGRIAGYTLPGARLDVLPDGLGSAVRTYANGGISGSVARFLGYGSLAWEVPGYMVPRNRWAGGWGYRTTGLRHAEQYVRARHLSTAEGRWTGVDPLWPGESAYGYSNSAPSSFVDPLGLTTEYIMGSSHVPSPCPHFTAGKFNSKSGAYFHELQIWAERFKTAAALVAHWLPVASDFMRHYIDATGTTRNLNMTGFLSNWEAKRDYNLELSAAKALAKSQPCDTEIVSRGCQGYAVTSGDYYYAVDDYQAWGKGRINCCIQSNGMMVKKLDFIYKIEDRYAWNPDSPKYTTIKVPGTGIYIYFETRYLSDMHLYGVAQEFNVRGEYKETVTL